MTVPASPNAGYDANYESSGIACIAYASFASRRILTCVGSGMILTDVSHHPASKYETSTYVC